MNKGVTVTIANKKTGTNRGYVAGPSEIFHLAAPEKLSDLAISDKGHSTCIRFV